MAKKKVVIVGVGSRSGSWIRAVKKHPDYEIIGIIDTQTELLENTGEIVKGLSEDDGFVSIDDMVKFSDKGKPDVAIIVTPIYTHHVLAKEIVDHGIHVICEKNMASNIYQGRQMVQLAVDHPELTTAIGTQYRYSRKWWTAHHYFANRENLDVNLGKISYIRWSSAGNWGESRTGWRRWLQEVYLEDMMPHWFDMIRFITGMDVVQVKCDTFIPNFSKWQGSSTAFANCALATPENYDNRNKWVWAQIYGDWQKRGKGVNSFDIYCEKGDAHIKDGYLDLEYFKDTEGKKVENHTYPKQKILGRNKKWLEMDWRSAESAILDQVSRSIDSGGKIQPKDNFAAAFKSFAVSMAAIESSRTGNTIWVPDYWKDLNI